MRGERRALTLRATALVNEAYLRLVNLQRVDWQNRAQFMAIASQVMRRVLVDLARSKQYKKRRGDAVHVVFDEAVVAAPDAAANILALNDALETLAKIDARKAQVIEMRFFGGLSVDETAEALKISSDTVMRDWRLAKSWLLRELRGETHDP